MSPFTQKWAIISLLENVPAGSEFHFTEFPLHVTLAGVFRIDHNGTWLTSELARLVDDQQSFEIIAEATDMFGPRKDVPVIRIQKTPELMELYSNVHSWLIQSGAVFNEPEYEDGGYLPHSTIHSSNALKPSDTRLITSVSLVDLFPHNDGHQRKISATINLSQT